ncbi:helix-turn-helix transcriptional regulator [Kitasatospora sp. SUK 42]|uniref:helix-turn-helix transcriptional regulator n=1 Tax=Kitasatospora sp. SUK 42 TaxID=1588882 RepID=UPI0018CB8832|nr:helix-turn-helix transcriptional regulator [Kitasatospora sp. SUK 42]MBV2155825.1 helix-turn-helix transcriptional regulator [Kitasatospora sp. SUK 42]
MANRRDIERRLLGDITDLSTAGLGMADLFRELNSLIRAGLPFDAGCWHGADPATGFLTSTVSEGLDVEGFRDSAQLELWSEDSTTFTAIRASGQVTRSMVLGHQGRPERSVRYRELLSAWGFADELRVNFDLQGGRWGSAAIMRTRGGAAAFSPAELALMERVSRQVASALRGYYLPPDSEPAAEAGPAVAILGPNDTLVSADLRAHALIAELAEDVRLADGIPSAFITAAKQARGLAVGGQAAAAARALLRTPTGQWLVVQASALEGRPDGSVAVVVTPAAASERMPVALLAFGLTARERDIALEVLRGRSTQEMAARFSLSPVTVQDHLKSIFNRTGVRSRREFVAQMMMSHFPAVAEPPTR